ncbi:MAG: Hsp20/alpha crystallin family protein [Desulfobulbaceae bacterium]|nr:Hsp20/alpha crystallin family protein [Desulfobulbaceae bacterium]
MLGLIPYRENRFPDLFKELEEVTRGLWPEVGWRGLTASEETEWAPRLDVTETDKTVEVKTELPGVTAKEVEVTLDRGLLVIKGEKKEEKEEKDRYYHRVERRHGTFCRSVRLPVEVKEEKIEATFKDGVLTVVLPKVETETKAVTHIEVH